MNKWDGCERFFKIHNSTFFAVRRPVWWFTFALVERGSRFDGAASMATFHILANIFYWKNNLVVFICPFLVFFFHYLRKNVSGLLQWRSLLFKDIEILKWKSSKEQRLFVRNVVNQTQTVLALSSWVKFRTGTNKPAVWTHATDPPV